MALSVWFSAGYDAVGARKGIVSLFYPRAWECAKLLGQAGGHRHNFAQFELRGVSNGHGIGTSHKSLRPAGLLSYVAIFGDSSVVHDVEAPFRENCFDDEPN